jgi:nucleoside-diphosphate-sugar epimerase
MVLVTGANGFIGKFVIDTLSENDGIIALDKDVSNTDDSRKVTFICCDILDYLELEKIFKQYKIRKILHLASLLNAKSNQNPGLATKINILGSLNLLELSVKYKIEKFIYGSSISIYGPVDSDENNPIHESIKTEPSHVYGSTKKYTEFLGNTYSKIYDIDFIAIRISTVIGPGAKNTSSPWRSEIYNAGPENIVHIPYNRNELLPLIFVKNVATMARDILLSKNIPHKIYNTPSETWRISDLENLLRKKNPCLKFNYGNNIVNDIPRYIDGNLFLKDFLFKPISIEESLDLK